MDFRKSWIIVAVGVLLLLVLAGCTVAEEPVLPEREIAVSLETALAAQESAIGQALASGEVTLTEEEVSSILTYLAQQNSGEYNVVEEIKVWMEGNGDVTAQISLLEGTLPEAFGGDDVVIKGNLQGTAEDEEEGAHFNSPKHYRFGLAAMVAQDDDAADAAEETLEEAADAAEMAAEEAADEAEMAAREAAAPLTASIYEFQAGQVKAAQEALPFVEDILNSVFSSLSGMFEDIEVGDGDFFVQL